MMMIIDYVVYRLSDQHFSLTKFARINWITLLKSVTTLEIMKKFKMRSRKVLQTMKHWEALLEYLLSINNDMNGSNDG